MGAITQSAAFLLVAGFLGAHAVQGPETNIPYSTNPSIVRIWLNTMGYNNIGLVLSKNYVLATGWTPFAYDPFAGVFHGDHDGDNTKRHAIANMFSFGAVTVIKVCPSLENHVPISFKSTDFYDYSANIAGDLYWIKRDLLLYKASTEILTNDNCLAAVESDPSNFVWYNQTEVQTCTAYTAETCTGFFDVTNKYFFAEPTLFIDNKPQAFMTAMDCVDDGTYNGILSFYKIGPFRDLIVQDMPVAADIVSK